MQNFRKKLQQYRVSSSYSAELDELLTAFADDVEAVKTGNSPAVQTALRTLSERITTLEKTAIKVIYDKPPKKPTKKK